MDSISLEPMSISKIRFNRQLSELDYNECKSSFLVKTSQIHNRPFFWGKILTKRKRSLELSVMVDSGGLSSVGKIYRV